MKQYKPETLIYVNQLKKFIESNDIARQYFLTGIDPEYFFNEVSDISESNFDKTGEPEVSKEQFEEIIKNGKPKYKKSLEVSFFPVIEIPNFGKFCLN